jgi:hypothetical protein
MTFAFQLTEFQNLNKHRRPSPRQLFGAQQQLPIKGQLSSENATRCEIQMNVINQGSARPEQHVN